MTPNELRIAAIKLFGERGYSAALAKALGVDYSQVWRYLSGRTPAPGPVVAAVKCWLEKGERDGFHRSGRGEEPKFDGESDIFA